MSPTSAAFAGLSSDAPRFFAELEADNSRAFFSANRDRYDRVVREPFLALLAALDPEGASSWRVYRPQRDTRFQPERGPYKTFVGAIGPSVDGTGRYLMLDRRGLLAATGPRCSLATELEAAEVVVRVRTAWDLGAETDRVARGPRGADDDVARGGVRARSTLRSLSSCRAPVRLWQGRELEATLDRPDPNRTDRQVAWCGPGQPPWWVSASSP